MSTVLVTGGSGFIGSHVIARLLAAGYRVRATVRDPRREGDVRALFNEIGPAPEDKLSFRVADLMGDAGWAEAVAGCEFVMHVASPLIPGVPKREDELIVPAREGTLRVLRAARDAGVKRVVLTSSFAAIGYGHAPRMVPFTESDWTDESAPNLSAYVKSKTFAERAAWDFIAREGRGLELSVVNPVVVLGPVLGPDFSASIAIVQRLLSGAIPGCPRLYFGIVDVRDVADLHLCCMTHPDAKGQRYLAVAEDFRSMREIALILKRRLGPAARKVTTRQLPDWLVRFFARFSPDVRGYLTELGKFKNASNAKARGLGWSPRSVEDAIVATAESLIRFGLIKGE